MKNRAALFASACLLGGFGALLGSIAGHALGPRGLMAGGIVGGLLGATASGILARQVGWIHAERLRRTVLGACAGFLVAAAIATHTLGSPLGPLLSTLLVGLGATLGAGQGRDDVVGENLH